MEERKHHLEGLIETWELELGAQKSLTEDNILELSSHLRDHVDELLERNLTEEEAFVIAKYQMGEVREMAVEYEKVNFKESSSKLLIQTVTGVALFFGFMYFQLIPIYTILIFGEKYGLTVSALCYLHSIVSISMMGGIGVLFWKMLKRNWLNYALAGTKSMLIIILFGVLSFTTFSSISWHLIQELNINQYLKIRDITGYHVMGYVGMIILTVITACFNIRKESWSGVDYV